MILTTLAYAVCVTLLFVMPAGAIAQPDSTVTVKWCAYTTGYRSPPAVTPPMLRSTRGMASLTTTGARRQRCG